MPDQDSDLAKEFARQAKEAADREKIPVDEVKVSGEIAGGKGNLGSGFESELKAKEDARKLLDGK